MKKFVWIIVIVLILLIILGILYGFFRRRKDLSERERKIISDIKTSPVPSLSSLSSEYQNVKEVFSKLWADHVRLTREFIIADLHNLPDTQSKADTLLKNQDDIATAVNQYYPGSYDITKQLLTDHILIAKDIVEDLKFKRFEQLPKNLNRWYDNSDQFSEVMQGINSNWNLKHHMREHLRITEREAIYEWLGLRNVSQNIYDEKIVPQAQEMADIFSNGILKTLKV